MEVVWVTSWWGVAGYENGRYKIFNLEKDVSKLVVPEVSLFLWPATSVFGFLISS